ncbi:MAG: flavodoxin [Oscillospiraceae bacterium]|nr:flavodoxin [Oscillospiraceae bacterium]
MKTAIIYHSEHHGNTRKLVDAIADKHEVTLIEAKEAANADLSPFDLIGLATGIYAFRVHPDIQSAADTLPGGKKVFLIYTCAMPKDSYQKPVVDAVEKSGCEFTGTFSCQGYNTFGPFKLIGGTSKGKPDENDLSAAVSFFESLI